MNFVDLETNKIFRIVEENTSNYPYVKMGNSSYLEIENSQTFTMLPAADLEVEVWDPTMAEVKTGKSIICMETDNSVVELIENEYFPDYELIAVIGGEVSHRFDIHCWKDDANPMNHSTTVWVDNVHVLDAKRGWVEELMSDAEALRSMFGTLV